MRDRPHRIPRTPKLDWPGGIVPEWAKAPAGAPRRGKGARGGKDTSKRERLQKVMAQSGHGSRRNIEILIAQGHIAINGQVAKLGDLVGPGDRVKLDGKLISLRFGTTLPRVLLYHKPEGEICTRDDPEGRPTVFAKLPKMNNARWVSIGRLDFNTSGLLIFTTNGELANRLMHPRYEIEREYAVRLMGELTPEQVQLLTGEGVDIDGEKCKFVRLVDKGGEGANHWYHVVLKEGKNREVRRMFETIGLMVSRLMRVRYGPVELPGFLKRGMTRDMAEADVLKLMEFAGMNEASADETEEEDEEEFSPGNVAPPGEVLESDEDYEDEVEDELQPAHLLEGWKPHETEILDEDDDRQPDFESLPAIAAMRLRVRVTGRDRDRERGRGRTSCAASGAQRARAVASRRAPGRGRSTTPRRRASRARARARGRAASAADTARARARARVPGRHRRRRARVSRNLRPAAPRRARAPRKARPRRLEGRASPGATGAIATAIAIAAPAATTRRRATAAGSRQATTERCDDRVASQGRLEDRRVARTYVAAEATGALCAR